MTTINDIAPGDNGADSLVDIEANFANLNTDKIERDGSIPMTGDLDMGANDITNIGAVRQKGDVQYDVKGYGATGDGSTDDTTAIQNALDAANTAGGGTVFFPEGSYKFTDQLTVYDNTTVEGQGMATVLESQNASAEYLITLNTNADNVILRDFVLDGNKASYESTHGIFIQGTNHTVQNVQVKDVKLDGFYFGDSTTKSVIDLCRVYDPDRCGISVGDNCTLIRVTNNYIEGTGAACGGINVIGGSVTDCLIDHNMTSGTGGDGLTGYANTLRRIQWSNNICLNPGNNGIHVGGSGITVKNNFFYNPTNRGVYYVNDDVSVGVHISMSGNYCDGVDNFQGLEVNSAQYLQVNDNFIINSGGQGILLTTVARFTANGNILRNNTSDGIRLTAAGTGTMIGNTCYGNGGAGIRATGTASSLIACGSNTCSTNTTWGILTGTGCDKFNVTGCVVVSNTSGQISLTGANNVNTNNITA